MSELPPGAKVLEPCPLCGSLVEQGWSHDCKQIQIDRLKAQVDLLMSGPRECCGTSRLTGHIGTCPNSVMNTGEYRP